MSYKIHLQNRKPPAAMRIAGRFVETRIVPETPPLQVVETKEEAKEAMRVLVAQGTPPSALYAVGYD